MAAALAADAPLASLAWIERALGVVSPGTPEEVAAVVRAAEAAGAALVPMGGATLLQTGYPPREDRPFLLLSTARLNAIIDHQPEDMTVTVEPGVTLAALQQALALRRQSLALDAPLSDRATMGGLVSANASGLLRPAFGTPRDLLIGVKAVMSEGVEIKGGGRVVKNVAGYDVCKLFTGAWGTLGILTELTFKIRTQPQEARFLAWNAPSLTEAVRFGLEWHHAQLAPTTIVVTNEISGAAQIVVGLEGPPERLDWQTQEFNRRAREAGLPAGTELADTSVTALRDRLARVETETALAARVACLPTELLPLTAQLELLPGRSLTVLPGVGTLALALPAVSDTAMLAIQKALPANANLVWTRLPAERYTTLDLWGRPRGEFKLHQSLKQTLDPRATFSPGRFYGRL